jgi:hypothetical protein
MGRNDGSRNGSRNEGRRTVTLSRLDDPVEFVEEDLIDLEHFVTKGAAISVIEVDSIYGSSWGFRTGEESYAIVFNGYETVKKIH